ncbi:MAG: flagellar basal body P-ring formation chaperone FlgA, partial [Gammaproteobacteria bacterium]
VFLVAMVIVSSGLLFGALDRRPSLRQPNPLGKGVCGKDAGPKPTGTSSQRPLRQGVDCPKGKGHQTAETMTNAFLIIILLLSLTSVGAEEYQSLEEIRDIAAAFLNRMMQHNEDLNRIKIGSIDSRLRLSQCASPPVAFLPPGASMRGNVTVGVRCSDPKPWKLYLSATVRIYRDVVVLRRALPRDARVGVEDVQLTEHDITDLHSPILTDIEEAVGKYLTRSFPADQPLTHSVLKNPLLIRKGQRVTLFYRSQGLEVRGIGTALKDGSRGERISVKPHGTARVVEGIASQPGVILVNPD